MTDQIEIDHTSPRPAGLEPGVTVTYDKYLSATCSECRGADLNGMPFGPPGQEVPSPNLTPGGPLAAWTEPDFSTVMRTGKTPGGKLPDEEMPWQYFGRMSDKELRALWMYLQSLPPEEQGG